MEIIAVIMRRLPSRCVSVSICRTKKHHRYERLIALRFCSVERLDAKPVEHDGFRSRNSQGSEPWTPTRAVNPMLLPVCDLGIDEAVLNLIRQTAIAFRPFLSLANRERADTAGSC
jgi:hypothetical protein